MAHVQGLRCRECGREYDGRADLHLRVVLRPARGRLRLRRDRAPRSAARRSRPGPLVAVALRRPAAGRRATRRSTSAPASRRSCAPTASRPSSASARSGSRTTRATRRTRSRTASSRSRSSKALEFGFKVAACASTGNLANSVAAHAAHAGCAATCSSRRTSSRARSSPPRSTAATSSRSTATTTTSTGSVRELAGIYDVGVRERQHAARSTPRARRRSRSRPPSSSAGRRPTTSSCPIASGSLLTKIRKGFEELHKVGLLDDEPHVRVSGAQALGCSPIATRVIDGADTIRPVKPDTIAKSLAIGNPADGYFALDAVRKTGGGVRGGHRRRDRRGHAAARADRGHLRRDRRRRDDRDAEEARGRRRDPPRRARRRVHHRPRAEDARGGRADRAARPPRSRRGSTRSTPRSTSRRT